MTRKDTIVLAVLINAGILIILFAGALKNDKNEQAALAQNALPTPATTPVLVEAPSAAPASDEVAQVLKQLAAQPSTAFSDPSATASGAMAMGENAAAPAIQEVAPAFGSDLAAAPVPAVEGLSTVAAEPVVEAAIPAMKEVKVKKGDFLDKIARQNHTTVEAIMAANNLSSTRLSIGQVLKIPAGTKKGDKAPAVSGEAKYYVVKNGDNPWTIATKNHMKVEELLKLNRLNPESAKRLKPGDKLRIK